jgi:uncharacterized protein YcbX
VNRSGLPFDRLLIIQDNQNKFLIVTKDRDIHKKNPSPNHGQITTLLNRHQSIGDRLEMSLANLCYCERIKLKIKTTP